jgi:DNA-binding response OmpR family regulator
MPNAQPLVAIINTSEEVVEFLREALEQEGYAHTAEDVLTFKRGERDVETFLQYHDPDVVIWDIGFPYEENWKFFTQLRERGVFNGRGLVLTTTNKHALESFTGPTAVTEIIDKPFALTTLLDAVAAALPGPRDRKQT